MQLFDHLGHKTIKIYSEEKKMSQSAMNIARKISTRLAEVLSVLFGKITKLQLMEIYINYTFFLGFIFVVMNWFHV